MPITVVVWSKAWTVFAHSNTGIMGSNPTQGMDVYVRLFHICVVLCVGRGLAMGWSPVWGVLLTAYRIKKLKKWSKPNIGLQSHNNNNCNSLAKYFCMKISCLLPSGYLLGLLFDLENAGSMFFWNISERLLSYVMSSQKMVLINSVQVDKQKGKKVKLSPCLTN
jgi:hypothetical protein